MLGLGLREIIGKHSPQCSLSLILQITLDRYLTKSSILVMADFRQRSFGIEDGLLAVWSNLIGYLDKLRYLLDEIFPKLGFSDPNTVHIVHVGLPPENVRGE